MTVKVTWVGSTCVVNNGGPLMFRGIVRGGNDGPRTIIASCMEEVLEVISDLKDWIYYIK